MLVDNINYLKKYNAELYHDLKSTDQQEADSEFEINVDKAISGDESLYYKDVEKVLRFHSIYDPKYEAKRILEGYSGIDSYEHILLYGVGLGYIYKELSARFPQKKLFIYEPDFNVLKLFLENQQLTDNVELITLEKDEKAQVHFINDLIGRTAKKFLIVETPSYKNIFKSKRAVFFSRLKAMLKDKRAGLQTNFSFQKKWVLNSMINFKFVLKTPSILMQNKDSFYEKPVLLVAAGPSLNDEIDNLKKIKEEGLAYIFAVGSAINTFLHHDFLPDALCSYDPTERNDVIFEKISRMEDVKLPLIFGSSIQHSVVSKYPSQKINMITSQDTISAYFLRKENEENLDTVTDGPSIAVVTLQLLKKMGFSKVYLVGQNLAYRDKEHYSRGMGYGKFQKKEDDESLKDIKTFKVKGVYGDEVETDETLNTMRTALEKYIQAYGDSLEIVNTTRDGAAIEGTHFIELNKVMAENLSQNNVTQNWEDRLEINYDKLFLENQLNRMEKEKESYHKLLVKADQKLKLIMELGKNKNFKQVDHSVNSLNIIFNQINKNHFFQVFLRPMNRVYYQLLIDSLKHLKEEKNKFTKVEKIYNEYGKFLHVCKKDMHDIEPVYSEIKCEIESTLEGA